MLVFVYGTLKKGFSNHYLLQDSEFIDEGITIKKYLMQTCGFPYVIYNKNLFKTYPDYLGYVKGEIYKINKKTLTELDYLEGYHSGHYDRDYFIIIDTLNNQHKCLMYFVTKTQNLPFIKPLNNILIFK